MMSRFNTDMICCGTDGCIEKERNHPQYMEAATAELDALKGGDFNFPGIGKPADL